MPCFQTLWCTKFLDIYNTWWFLFVFGLTSQHWQKFKLYHTISTRDGERNRRIEMGTRGPRATIRSPEWHSHCRHADAMQHLSNPIIATNENIIIWAVLSFEEEYMGLTVNGAWSLINYQSDFNRRINVKFGGNWLSGFWRIVILYM